MAPQSYKSARKILLGEDNNALVMLFAINALVFLLINFIKIIYYLTNAPVDLFYSQILNWFTLPASLNSFITRPWTLISYMFTHLSIWHLISSATWLWAFGYILQDLAGNNKIIPVYLYGGFIGGIIFIISGIIFPASIILSSPMIGGGPAVMAIAIATTTLTPGYRIFPMINGGIPLWILTLVYIAISFGSVSGNNIGAIAAQLAAAGVGFFYIRQIQNGRDWGKWMIELVRWLNRLCDPDKRQTPSSIFRANRTPYEKITQNTQEKLDAILDKINQKGFSSLTKEEKTFLEKTGEE